MESLLSDLSPGGEQAFIQINAMVTGGMSLDAVVANMSYVPPKFIAEGRAAFEQRAKMIREIPDPGFLSDPKLVKGLWYAGPRRSDLAWPTLKSRLDRELPPDAVESVDAASSRIISLSARPGETLIDTRGLVLGYVQSGKTTNFMAVMAKALDVGYRLVIVLSGTTENLRRQTQQRIDEYLVDPLGTHIHSLTTQELDFHATGKPDAILGGQLKVVAVVKKNGSRLNRLRAWIASAPKSVLATCPILIIDDEADQASIDVGGARQSRINGLIREILAHPKAGYIAYTATPFANLLIDPEGKRGNGKDLYPRDFIVDLPRPKNYFGAEQIFGSFQPDDADDLESDGLNVVRIIPNADVAISRPPRARAQLATWTPEVPASMESAIDWFVLATTARRLRHDVIRHSSMLIHTSMIAEAHEKTAEAVEDYLEVLSAGLKNEPDSWFERLHSQWTRETDTVNAQDFGREPIQFMEIWSRIRETIAATKIVVDNYKSLDRLEYDPKKPSTAIVIGGNTLSRGLTLEGLIASYFVRSSSAYDTLLQMGRWFGYRVGYEDLIRIWMSAELKEWFFMLSVVESEIRSEIRVFELEGKTPAELPVKIRTHPQMSVTSAAKMKSHAKAKVSYSGRRVQTILFKEKNEEWLNGNINAVRRLFFDLKSNGIPEQRLGGARRGFLNVPVDNILEFLAEYRLHEDSRSIDKSHISAYIEKEVETGDLHNWNVVLMEPDSGEPELDLGLSTGVKLRSRTKMSATSTAETANLKAVASTPDRIADLDVTIDNAKEMLGLPPNSKPSDADLRRLRKLRERGAQTGLLCIYPIAGSSGPPTATRSTDRSPLDAPSDLMAICLLFPESRNDDSTVDYVSAPVSPDYLEDISNELLQADEMDESLALREESPNYE